MDHDALLKLIEIQKLAGVAALTVCGTTGESVTMTPGERGDVIAFCVKNKGQMKIIAGAGGNDTARALEDAKAAGDAGADAVLAVTPYYNKPTQAGLTAHYTYIADRVRMPVILYNIPSRTGTALAPETVLELSKHPNINGIKEAGPGTALTSFIMSTCPEDMNVWSGNDAETVPLMALGARGVISVASNLIPREMTELSRLCLLGEFGLAARMQAKYHDLMTALFYETNPIPVKTALSEMGLCGGELRLPLCPMGAQNREKLKAALRKYGLIN